MPLIRTNQKTISEGVAPRLIHYEQGERRMHSTALSEELHRQSREEQKIVEIEYEQYCRWKLLGNQ